jgi:cytochrome P450
MEHRKSDVDSGRQTLATYLPEDTAQLTSYQDVVEAVRSTKGVIEPAHPSEAPFLRDTLHELDGPPHIKRRRIMNRLVRPDALERYREEIAIPSVLRQLEELSTKPDLDGHYKADLVQISRRIFMEFAAAVIGLDTRPPTAIDKLLVLLDGFHHAVHGKFFPNWQPYLEAGLEAKRIYQSDFYEPVMAACASAVHKGDKVEHGATLIALLASQEEEAWEDLDAAVRETIPVMLGTVETSSNLLTNSVHELSLWLEKHPEDRKRLYDLDFLATVIQETLRFHPSAPHIGRVANDDITLSSGRVVHKGQWIAAMAVASSTDKEIFGPDADVFNPHRVVQPGIPRYATAFGAGEHQCLGLRVVLGNAGVGAHTHILRTYLAAGIRPDRDRRPILEQSERGIFSSYPVEFDHPNAVRR